MVNINDMSKELIEELAFSDDEINELKLARERQITFDEECPETTPEKAVKYKRVNPQRGNGARRA
jgi:hypothetical protein